MIRDDIKELAIDLPVGLATHVVCPACKASHERSMRLYRTDTGVWAECYRAKCGYKAFVASVGTVAKQPQTKRFVPSYFMGELVSLPNSVKDLLWDRYQISDTLASKAGFRYNPAHHKLWMPIHNYRGYPIGEQTKALGDPGDYPKSITYFSYDSPKAHFAQLSGVDSSTIVLVEDILSAWKVATIIPSCALLGHSLSAGVVEVLSSNYDNVVVMLDPDALDKAIDIKSKISLYFRNFSVVQLSKDPKDTDMSILEEVINGQ